MVFLFWVFWLGMFLKGRKVLMLKVSEMIFEELVLCVGVVVVWFNVLDEVVGDEFKVMGIFDVDVIFGGVEELWFIFCGGDCCE